MKEVLKPLDLSHLFAQEVPMEEEKEEADTATPAEEGDMPEAPVEEEDADMTE